MSTPAFSSDKSSAQSSAYRADLVSRRAEEQKYQGMMVLGQLFTSGLLDNLENQSRCGNSSGQPQS